MEIERHLDRDRGRERGELEIERGPERLSPRCCPPGLPLGLNGDRIPGLEETPETPAAAAAAAGTAATAAAAGVGGGRWRIASLSLLLQLHARKPLTVLCYPPAADAAAAEPRDLSSAVSKLRCWITSQQQPQQPQQQQQLVAGVVSSGFQRKRMLIDGLDCIRRLTNPQDLETMARVRESLNFGELLKFLLK
ncbi:hypothetical protein ACSSS7_005643 [Eimeria intestinalis]